MSLFRVLSFFFSVVLIAACAKPIAKFAAPDTKLTAPTQIDFLNQSEKAESYSWDFGDGNTSTEFNPSHRYTSSGNYLVTLKASKKQKTAVSSQRIQILGPTNCMVEIITPYGNMLVELSDKTPLHRDNFIKLIEENFYDDLLFHRVIDGFMLQGGDPNSRGASQDTRLGSGGPGYQIPAEFDQELVHVKGALAAARLGGPVNPEKKSSGSQFYIVSGRPVTDADLDAMQTRKGITYSSAAREQYLKDGGVPFLDADYTVFGRVVEGFDVIDAIAQAKTDGSDRPVESITMKIKSIK